MTFRLAFMGSPEFAVPCLAEVIAAGHDVACVYTQPPRRAGRGRALRPTAVHDFAESQGIEVRSPVSLKPIEEKTAFSNLNLDVAVVVAYGLILPRAILDAPRLGCINVHASLLPRWRGAAPIQRALMAGDELTGVQTMQMESGLDTGPVLMSESARIFPFDTAKDLHDRLSALGASLLPRTLAALERGSVEPTPQSEEGITYAHKITADDTRIDWTRPAFEIDCQIRGLAPSPGAWFEHGVDGQNMRMKALFSKRLDDEGPPGTVLDNDLTIACGNGSVRLLRVQKPGKGPVDVADFLRGTPIAPGTVLG